MKLIREDWEALTGYRQEFVRRFYELLFERHPNYRAMFPDTLDSQHDRMVEMISAVVRFADHADLLRPYLFNVGYAHRRLGIKATDVENFKRAFVDTLGALRAPDWDEEHVRNWHLAFDDLVVPLFDEGLETRAQA